MSQRKINIVSFDIPYPADYGGVIDVFYKIKALHKAGFEIILHCFAYGRKPQSSLEKYCKTIHYYKRKKGLRYFFTRLPYIVITRNNSQLLNNLKENNYPILFEGLHTCFFLNHPGLRNRIKIARMHNIEHQYYIELFKASKNIIKSIYYFQESIKLKRFEKILSEATFAAAISKNDFNYFYEKHKNTFLLPAFHSMEKITSKHGTGSYFLYHGNLAVEENEKAALFLIGNVFNNLKIPFKIAGKSPSKHVKNICKNTDNIELVPDPSDKVMTKLIQDAQCCILPTFQATGLKLKLLASLFSGRYIIANNKMVNNTGLESLCMVANTPGEFINLIKEVSDKQFTKESIEIRSNELKKYMNYNSVQILLNELETL